MLLDLKALRVWFGYNVYFKKLKLSNIFNINILYCHENTLGGLKNSDRKMPKDISWNYMRYDTTSAASIWISCTRAPSGFQMQQHLAVLNWQALLKKNCRQPPNCVRFICNLLSYLSTLPFFTTTSHPFCYFCHETPVFLSFLLWNSRTDGKPNEFEGWPLAWATAHLPS